MATSWEAGHSEVLHDGKRVPFGRKIQLGTKRTWEDGMVGARLRDKGRIGTVVVARVGANQFVFGKEAIEESEHGGRKTERGLMGVSFVRTYFQCFVILLLNMKLFLLLILNFLGHL